MNKTLPLILFCLSFFVGYFLRTGSLFLQKSTSDNIFLFNEHDSLSSFCFQLGLITDLDHESRNKEKFEWKSIYQRVDLSFDLSSSSPYPYSFSNGKYEPIEFTSNHNRKNRSMELSSLKRMSEDILWGFCDYTGFVYELDLKTQKTNPLVYLATGDGQEAREIPFKNEWSTWINNDQILVGSIGKEWVVNKKEIHTHCEFVKRLTIEREADRFYVSKIEHLDWRPIYRKLREISGFEKPGYLIHEAIYFNRISRKWIILPRKMSTELYEEDKDELKGSNLLIIADEEFKEFNVSRISKRENEEQQKQEQEEEYDFGFSSIVQIPVNVFPNNQHHYVGVKVKERFLSKTTMKKEEESRKTVMTREITNSEEGEYVVESKLIVFNEQGKILSEEFDLGNLKFEGIDVVNQC